jgi:predicted nucleotidyltransferase
VELSKVDIQFLKSFFSKKPVKKAYLFGSYSRGAADQHSDVDILVELDYTQHIGIGFIKMKYEIEDALNKRVDLVSEQSLSKHIRPFIAEDKQLIYER